MSDQVPHPLAALLDHPAMTADQAAVDAILNAAAQSEEANVASGFPQGDFGLNGSGSGLVDAEAFDAVFAAAAAAEAHQAAQEPLAEGAAPVEEAPAPEEPVAETSNLRRRTSSRALASARTYKEIDEDDASIDEPPSPASSEASGRSSNRSRAPKRPRKKSTGGAPLVGIPLSFTAARELSLLARLKLTRQSNRGPAWRTGLTLFPEDYLKSLTTPESRDFLKVFNLKDNTLIIRPPPTAARLNKALTILHTAAATPDSSDLYKSWVAAKYDGENLLLAGALREQIMRYLTRHKNRPDPVEKNSSKKAAKDDDEDELNDFEEEGDDEDEAGPSHKKARHAEPKLSEEDAVGEPDEEEDAVGELEEEDAQGEPDVEQPAASEAAPAEEPAAAEAAAEAPAAETAEEAKPADEPAAPVDAEKPLEEVAPALAEAETNGEGEKKEEGADVEMKA